MIEILRLLKTFEVWLYILLGVVGFFYLQKFVVALAEWRNTVFGLEKENAQRRINEAVTVLVLAVLLASGEFFITSFVLPNVPGIAILNTPTMNVLFTPTVTLHATYATPLTTGTLSSTQNGTELATTPSGTKTVTPESSPSANGCIAGKLELTFPKDGDEVSGVVALKGTIAVTDFGFYKYEYSTAGSNTWVTIAAGNQIKSDGSIGNWNVSLLNPGDYQLRLVVYDNQGVALTPCVISVKILAPTATPI